MTTEAPNEVVTLRIAGLGHTVTLELAASCTVKSLQEKIEKVTKIPVEYQRLLARGHKLEDQNTMLQECGIKGRTKIMLMHNALYAQEKDGFEALSKLSDDIDDLAVKKESIASNRVKELVTRLCCRLDEVETAGSANLRTRRKELLKRAEALDGDNDKSKSEEM